MSGGLFPGQVAWRANYKNWSIFVSQVAGDPAPHVVAWGEHPTSGLIEAHAERQLGATPATVRAWIDGLLAGSPAVGAVP